MDEYSKLIERQRYALKIEGRCIAITVIGLLLMLIVGVVTRIYTPLIFAGQLWVSCWFCGCAMWSHWYVFRKGKSRG